MTIRTRPYTIEKIENGAKISGEWVDTDRRTSLSRMRDVLLYICGDIEHKNIPEGNITEIKVTQEKDGSIFVCVTGSRDRIFAKMEAAR